MNSKAQPSLDFIFGRRSIRVYSPGEIPKETVTKLLEAAMAAPSAMTKDPWRFIIVRETHLLAQLAGALPGGKMLVTAQVAIVVCGDIESAFENNISYMLQDCSAATENILLAAHAHGLGGCWVGVHPGEESIRRLKQLLSLPAVIVPLAVVSLGHPGEQPPARTRYNPGFVHFEKWG